VEKADRRIDGRLECDLLSGTQDEQHFAGRATNTDIAGKRVPATHPICEIKRFADATVRKLDSVIEARTDRSDSCGFGWNECRMRSCW
jgi:hypothetical protein